MVITTKGKSMLYTEGASIDANYGPWDSIEDFEAFREENGLDIPDGVTIAIKGDKISKFVRDNGEWRQEGLTQTVLPSETPSADNSQQIMEVDKEGFLIVDEEGNIGLKYDTDGLDVAKVSPHLLTLLTNEILTGLDDKQYVQYELNE